MLVRPPTSDDMVRAAIAYAAQGWPVLPLAGVVQDRQGGLMCSCKLGPGCLSAGKHPVTYDGLFDATTDPVIINSWPNRYRSFNIGIRTGVKFDALDIDGDEGFASLSMVVGAESFDGLVQETGRGRHLIVAPTGYTNRAHMRPGIDYRGVGGYIVVAPSLHVSGVRYRWQSKTPVGAAPQWLEALLAPDPDRCLHILPSGRECGRLEPHRHRGGIEYPAHGLGLL